MLEIFREIAAVVLDAQTVSAFFLALSFVILYGRFFNWRKTRGGRAVMYFFRAVVLVALSGAAVRVFGPEYLVIGREIVSFLAWGALIATLINLLYALYRSWKKGDLSLIVEPKTRPTDVVDER